MTADPCNGDRKNGSGCTCPPPFGSDAVTLPAELRAELVETAAKAIHDVECGCEEPEPVAYVDGEVALDAIVPRLSEHIAGQVRDWIINACSMWSCADPEFAQAVAEMFTGIGITRSATTEGDMQP